RIPKGMAPISEYEGRVKIEETEKTRKIIVVPDDGSEEAAYQVPMRSRLLVSDGGHVAVGQQLIAGAVNPHEVLRILGGRAVQLHLVHEVQEVYRSQGVSIHDKHIEIIIRQMLKRVNVLESGDTELLPGDRVEPTDDARSSAFPPGSYAEPETYAFGQGSGEAVPLEEYDFGSYNR